MNGSAYADLLGPELSDALEKKGFTALTAVQQAVLSEELVGRDLRITSQTGSGKTVAIGLALRAQVQGDASADAHGVARPLALVVAPTRELARQVELELSWLYAGLRARVASATGGANYRDERRALAAGPAVVVGTPGRLLDHLTRGAINAQQVRAVVLDEADRMLDLGFKEDLEAILAHAPKGHRTHLVSATFAPETRALADRVQRNPAHVEGTRLGAANTDIDHVIHLIDSRQRLDAIINLLLANPDAQTLVFARTRIDVAEITRALDEAGFSVTSLSGEMLQNARNRALEGFKRGKLQVLVATDVAARGIDVQDISRVIHAEPPTNADNYTHRSGRTGRAGRKGVSSMLVSPSALRQAVSVLERARVRYRFEPIPSVDEIKKLREARIVDELTSGQGNSEETFDESIWSIAKTLSEAPDLTRIFARLLDRARFAGPTEPRSIRHIDAPTGGRPDRALARGKAPRSSSPTRTREPFAHRSRDIGREDFAGGEKPRKGGRDDHDRSWVTFRVSWGSERGADARRLLAMACRRGDIRGSDVGAIRIERNFSVIDVDRVVAEGFAKAAARPDPRDPKLSIRRADDSGAARASAGRSPEREAAPRAERGAVKGHGRTPGKKPERETARRPERDSNRRPERGAVKGQRSETRSAPQAASKPKTKHRKGPRSEGSKGSKKRA